MIGKYFYTYLTLFLAISFFITLTFNYILNVKNKGNTINLKSINYKPLCYTVVIFSLICFYSAYITMIPLWEEFTYQDSNIFWETLRDGHQFYGNPIWYDSGRFFPLGHQEFEQIAKINASNYSYHLFAIFEMIAIFFISLKAFGKKTGTIFFILLTISCAFIQSFYGLIYPERNMALLLMLSLLLLKAGIEQNSGIKITISILTFSIFLFYKETAFLITLGISASFFVSYILNKEDKLKLLAAIALLFISSLWIASYFIDIYPTIDKAYGNPSRDVAKAMSNLIISPWIYTSLASLLIFVFKQRKSSYILLPIVPIGYSFTMYYMNFPMPYYHLPSVLISLYCVFINAEHFEFKTKPLVIALLSVYTIVTSTESINIIRDRKESVFAKADALDFIFKNNALIANTKIKASFNFSDPWTVHILSGTFTSKYKIEMKGRLGGDCKNVDYAIYFDKKPKFKLFYTSESVPMWKSKYKLYVVKCS